MDNALAVGMKGTDDRLLGEIPGYCPAVVYVLETEARGMTAVYADETAAKVGAIEFYFENVYPYLKDCPDRNRDSGTYTVAEQIKDDMLSLLGKRYIEDCIWVTKLPFFPENKSEKI